MCRFDCGGASGLCARPAGRRSHDRSGRSRCCRHFFRYFHSAIPAGRRPAKCVERIYIGINHRCAKRTTDFALRKVRKRNEQRRALKNGAGLLANPRQAPVLARRCEFPAAFRPADTFGATFWCQKVVKTAPRRRRRIEGAGCFRIYIQDVSDAFTLRFC